MFKSALFVMMLLLTSAVVIPAAGGDELPDETGDVDFAELVEAIETTGIIDHLDGVTAADLLSQAETMPNFPDWGASSPDSRLASVDLAQVCGSSTQLAIGDTTTLERCREQTAIKPIKPATTATLLAEANSPIALFETDDDGTLKEVGYAADGTLEVPVNAGTDYVINTDDTEAEVTLNDPPTCAGQPATHIQTGGEVYYGPGDQVVIANGFYNRIHLEDGDDIACGSDRDDEIYGGDGNDILHANLVGTCHDYDLVYGEAGQDIIFVGHVNYLHPSDRCGVNAVSAGYGGSGDDVIFGGPQDATMHGGFGDDRLYGQGDNDTMFGGSGQDIMVGGEGRDQIIGHGGSDQMFGGPGDDTLEGQAGHDRIEGQSGDDQIDGGPDNDILFGGAGDDYIEGGDGTDELYGQNGHDELRGDDGNDRLFGWSGNDELFGGPGDDYVYGQGGNDQVHGNAGTDFLAGAQGNDQLFGGSGGPDICNGGTGTDTADINCETTPNVP